ncbi:MAG: sel1 repeat family protein [Arcobacter sp.]|nr:sel1 repeat family protein [Arcobacter sp.]
MHKLVLILLFITYNSYASKVLFERENLCKITEEVCKSFNVGYVCLLGVSFCERDEEKANLLLKKASIYLKNECDVGIGISCFLNAVNYNDNKNYMKMNEYLKKGCTAKDSLSCIGLAGAYEEGLGLRQNLDLAKEYYGKACDLGNQEGCDKYKRLNR